MLNVYKVHGGNAQVLSCHQRPPAALHALPEGEALGERIRRRLAVDPVASGAPLLLPKGVDVPAAMALVGGEGAGPALAGPAPFVARRLGLLGHGAGGKTEDQGRQQGNDKSSFYGRLRMRSATTATSSLRGQ